MGQRFTARYAAVVSTLALVVALSGTAYAVNSVRSSDIVNNTIKTEDMSNRAITTAKAAPSSLGRSSRLFAQVTTGFALGPSFGVTEFNHPEPGFFTFTFNRDIEDCAVAVTPRGNSAVFTQASHFNGGELDVAFETQDGTTQIDPPFDVVVIC